MTHMGPMKDSEGDFANWMLTDMTCHKCQGHQVAERKWESHDGAFEDYQYRCNDCGHKWWVEGSDA